MVIFFGWLLRCKVYSVYINCAMVYLNYNYLEFSVDSLNVTIVFEGVLLLINEFIVFE